MESHETFNCLKIDEFRPFWLKVLIKSISQALSELLIAICSREELHLWIGPLNYDLNALSVELLCASKLAIFKAFSEDFTDSHISQFLVYHITCVLNQIKSYLKISSVNQLVEHRHGLLKHVELFDFLSCSLCDNFSSLQGVQFEHLSHLLFFEVIYTLFCQFCLRLNGRKIVFDIVKIVKGYSEFVEVLSQFSAQVFLNDDELLC